MPNVIVKSKLHPPLIRKNHIRRARLIDKLDQGFTSGRKLSVISAPAGFGKTTLACDWLEQSNLPRIWISLGQEDSNEINFLAYLIAAIQTLTPENSDLPAFQLEGLASNESMLASLVNAFECLNYRFVIVLDNYHFAESDTNNQTLSYLLTHVSTKLHLVILSRYELRVHLARHRVLDQVTEIGANELLLNQIELECFVQTNVAPDLTTYQIEALQHSTEGWLAGLHLIAALLPQQVAPEVSIESLCSDNQDVFDYLLEEIFLHQDRSLREFLVRTAILDSFRADLCQFVISEQNLLASEALEYLRAANLLASFVDNDSACLRPYRFLQQMLRKLQGRHFTQEQISGFHLRASTWFEQQNDLPNTFNHAIASRDMNLLAQMAERHWESMSVCGQHNLWLEWQNHIPEAVFSCRPILCVQTAWSMMIQGQYEASEIRLRAAEMCLKMLPLEMNVVAVDQFQDIAQRIAFVRCLNAHRRGDVFEAIMNIEELILYWRATRDRLALAQARCMLIACYRLRGDLDLAQQLILESIDNARLSKDTMTAAICGLQAGQLMSEQGYLADAMSFFQRLIRHSPEPLQKSESVLPHLYVECALIAYEIGEKTKAKKYLEQAHENATSSCRVDWRYRYHLVLAKMKESEDDIDAAHFHLDEAQKLMVPNLLPEIRSVEVHRMNLFLKQGETRRVKNWCHRMRLSITDEPYYLYEFEHLLIVRMALLEAMSESKQVNFQSLDLLLSRLLVEAKRQSRLRSQLEILKLKALLYHSLGNQKECMQLLEQTIQLARPEAFVSFFVEEGKPMQLMLLALRGSLQDRDGIASTNLAYLETILKSFPERLIKDSTNMFDPLSQRELDVLKLIAEGCSNEEICQRLFLALDTVKGHNRRIFDKLLVRRRTEAIVRAQKLGLI